MPADLLVSRYTDEYGRLVHIMTNHDAEPVAQSASPGRLKFLDPEIASLIDRALQEVGDFGEVRLLVEKGRLRFIQKTRSEKVANSER